MVSWSELFSVSPSEGGMNLCLSFLSAIYLSPGRELLSWVADILGCVSHCTDKSILTSSITVRITSFMGTKQARIWPRQFCRSRNLVSKC